MRKSNSMMMALTLLLGATSCTSCNIEKQNKENTVELIISSDYSYMSAHYTDFVWYECQITLANWLDVSYDGTVKSVANVFQYIADGQPHVIIFSHYGDRCDTTRHNDIWIEDCAMKPADIKLTFSQAYERLMATNYPKPHSQKCILRTPVGPYDCNAQYVFGNISEPLFVDAVTGNVTNTNPAFNRRE